mmetsp:Transcript_16534/g.35767  ORF Transcript_16534/g.35767 Transcript_16534/m.35767 type:complete len:84 (-) Transcript_16534:477-728(-)
MRCICLIVVALRQVGHFLVAFTQSAKQEWQKTWPHGMVAISCILSRHTAHFGPSGEGGATGGGGSANVSCFCFELLRGGLSKI